MTKEIMMVTTKRNAQNRYGYRGSAPLVRIIARVDCDKLSVPARMIAESIMTTELSDDTSLLWVIGASTYERLMSEGKKKETETSLQSFGDLAQIPESISWTFDALRSDESPEEYFERQVNIMRKVGAHAIKTRTGKQYNFIA